MKKLSRDLKRMLSGLASQNAGEFSSRREKMAVLGFGKIGANALSAAPSPTQPKAARRIALISNGKESGAPLDYAIDAGLRQDAQIDLLLHGAIDTASLSALQNRVQQAGLVSQCISLGAKAVDGITAYISNQPALIFLVSTPDDPATRVLMEEIIPHRDSRIPVPLVLIENRTTSRSRTSSSDWQAAAKQVR